MTFGLIDIILAIVAIISVLFALYRGLVRELLGIAAWILAGFAALYTYTPIQPLMNKFIENKVTAGIVGSSAIALIILVIMTLINSWIAKRLRQSALSGLDRILGFIFGVARAALLMAIIYIACAMFMPGKKLNELEEQNISVPYVRIMAGWIECIIPETVKEDMKSYEQGKLNLQKGEKIGINLKKTVQEELAEYRENDKKSLDEMIDQIAGE